MDRLRNNIYKYMQYADKFYKPANHKDNKIIYLHKIVDINETYKNTNLDQLYDIYKKIHLTLITDIDINASYAFMEIGPYIQYTKQGQTLRHELIEKNKDIDKQYREYIRDIAEEKYMELYRTHMELLAKYNQLIG